ncbi:MAG: hypothetical protein IPN77_26410 [Sandaracinaceae bacterium]|nr:hypothetical protein [Sandaracinaceae bacterium]
MPDDTACNAGVEASDCGPYPSRFCNGLASQVSPVCGGSCSGNGQCDVDAHCSGGRLRARLAQRWQPAR